MSADPIDARLWTHILLMILSFAILMPIGQVLGLVKSKWHVPCQIIATIIAVVGYFLALTHGGRQFAHPNIHVTFGNSLMLMLAVQVGLGAGLKLHLEQRSGWLGKIFGGKVGTSGRRGVVLVHSLIGKAMPVFAWVQMLFGGIIAMGYCQFNDTLGQCVAHGIMGSAFIAYGIISAILLLVGQAWLRRTGKSQEFFDSAVITLWGCINSLTEHRWGHPWVKNDLQHTSMGVIWTCGGLLSLFLSKSRSGKPRRNLMPSLIIFITGWGMSAHPQELMLSTMVHTVFGFSLMAAAACRGIEIAFVLRDSRGHGEPHSWQHLCPFVSQFHAPLSSSANKDRSYSVLLDSSLCLLHKNKCAMLQMQMFLTSRTSCLSTRSHFSCTCSSIFCCTFMQSTHGLMMNPTDRLLSPDIYPDQPVSQTSSLEMGTAKDCRLQQMVI